jgi:hypothetical protein
MALVRIAYIIAIIGTGFSLLNYFLSIGDASGAPQQAAGAAMALVLPVSLYVIARGLEAVARNADTKSDIKSEDSN